MATTKAPELRELSVEELRQRIEETRKSLLESRLKHLPPHRHLESPADLRKMRRQVARLKTVLNEKLSKEG